MSSKRSLEDQLEAAVQALLSDRPPTALDARVAALIEVAADLPNLPTLNFVERLAADLKREAAILHIATLPKVREGFHTVTPYIAVENALELVEFVKKAFGAKETHRTVGSTGGFHIEIRLGEDMLMIGGGGQWKGSARPTSLHYFVNEVDAVYQRALQAGAVSLQAPVDQPYGVREAAIKDLSGNHWYLSTRMKDAQGRDYPGLRTVAVYLHPKGADRLIDFLKRGFGAEEIEVHRAPDRGTIVHAKLRILDSVLEVGEAHGPWQPMPTQFFLYVQDPDALYLSALQAGATALHPVTHHAYGRGGALQDPHGNQWFIHRHADTHEK